jgi:hypothetical protein
LLESIDMGQMNKRAWFIICIYDGLWDILWILLYCPFFLAPAEMFPERPFLILLSFFFFGRYRAHTCQAGALPLKPLHQPSHPS